MKTTRLGSPIHEECGYCVREVFGADDRSEGFTFEGPGFDAIVIYRSAGEAKLALQELAWSLRRGNRRLDSG